MGRKPKDIDGEGVYRLASYGCTLDDVADYFNCSKQTICNRFLTEFRLGHATVKKNIRMWQVRRAAKGSDVMLIHLGKHYVGQTDKNRDSDDLEKSPANDGNGNPIEP